MKKQTVLNRLSQDRLVPVVRADSEDSALTIVDALLAGGVSIIEVTMTVPGAVDVIRRIAKLHGNKVLLGAGTVLDAKTAQSCVDAGAQFIVSPTFDAATVAACNLMEVVVVPGALTPTEILNAWLGGADVVKIFPCDSMGGPGYVKSIRAPLPQIPVMPTGGVTLDNLADFIRAGAIAVGVGGNLVDPTMTAQQLTARAMAFVDRARSAS